MSQISILVVSGVEGPSLYINNFRIVGSKPWGGGDIIKEWKVEMDDLRRDLVVSGGHGVNKRG